MFNYQARQIFVIHPRNAGGGILSFLFSLDKQTASINFKHESLKKKLNDWNNFVDSKASNAHAHGFLNLGHPDYLTNIAQADRCDTYIHKTHFYEIYADAHNPNINVLEKMSNKQGVGIYLTERCIDALVRIRPNTPCVDLYQLWIYAHQSKLLETFYGITCRHVFPFVELLDINFFMDHLIYCKDIFNFDTGLDTYQKVVQQWYSLIGHA